MNWITDIGKAIGYIEENLTEDIDYGEAAKRAGSSVFHFQRVFGIICGYTLGDYIRMRRLSLAGQEIIASDKKIIDIAIKYGYDTPESFSRAFARFHGLSPTEARKSGQIKSFSQLSVKLILTGGDTMDYRIERKEGLKVACKKRQFAKPGDDYTQTEIPAFWQECKTDGTIEKICMGIPKASALPGLLGICFSEEITEEGFPYGIGAEYTGGSVADGLEIVEIPAYTYAVFTVKGKMPDAFRETYRRVCTEFFQQSDYEYGNGVEIEVYPSADVQNPDYTCELWIAVKHK